MATSPSRSASTPRCILQPCLYFLLLGVGLASCRLHLPDPYRQTHAPTHNTQGQSHGNTTVHSNHHNTTPHGNITVHANALNYHHNTNPHVKSKDTVHPHTDFYSHNTNAHAHGKDTHHPHAHNNPHIRKAHTHGKDTTHLHAHHHTHTHTPTYTLRRKVSEKEVLGRNLSCGNLEETVIGADRTKDFIDAIKDNYTLGTVNLTWSEMALMLNPTKDNSTLTICDEEGQGCMLVLPSLPPPPHTPPSTEQETRVIMVKVYGYILRYIVALETLVLDQSLYEALFMQEMVTLHDNLEDLAIELLTQLTSCNLTPDQHLVSDLTIRMYRGEAELQRDRRGFCTLRQTSLGLQYIMDAFSDP
ncbi:hypothetical protein Pmani_032666 [Petrolisthes manimaculis]|uniref:Uncharacterized protein n=1 Tax=Petrolisthes manimaculis TaxID=1843537 RepID=A0AAE1NSP2_9EUCA|nr:hypothetical protein Pmani_032666 [Petrolisthes manimaculis]